MNRFLVRAMAVLCMLTMITVIAVPKEAEAQGHGQVGVLNVQPLFRKVEILPVNGYFMVDVMLYDSNGYGDLRNVTVNLTDPLGMPVSIVQWVQEYYLFTMSSDLAVYMQELGPVDEFIKQEFEKKNITLGKIAEVIYTDERNWEIKDNGRRYLMERNNGDIYVYQENYFSNVYGDELVIDRCNYTHTNNTQGGLDVCSIELKFFLYQLEAERINITGYDNKGWLCYYEGPFTLSPESAFMYVVIPVSAMNATVVTMFYVLSRRRSDKMAQVLSQLAGNR